MIRTTRELRTFGKIADSPAACRPKAVGQDQRNSRTPERKEKDPFHKLLLECIIYVVTYIIDVFDAY